MRFITLITLALALGCFGKTENSTPSAPSGDTPTLSREPDQQKSHGASGLINRTFGQFELGVLATGTFKELGPSSPTTGSVILVNDALDQMVLWETMDTKVWPANKPLPEDVMTEAASRYWAPVAADLNLKWSFVSSQWLQGEGQVGYEVMGHLEGGTGKGLVSVVILRCGELTITVGFDSTFVPADINQRLVSSFKCNGNG